MDFKPGVRFGCTFVGFGGSQIIRGDRPVAANDDAVPRDFDNEDLAGAFVFAKMLSCSCFISHVLSDGISSLYAATFCIKYNPYISRSKPGLAVDFNGYFIGLRDFVLYIIV